MDVGVLWLSLAAALSVSAGSAVPGTCLGSPVMGTCPAVVVDYRLGIPGWYRRARASEWTQDAHARKDSSEGWINWFPAETPGSRFSFRCRWYPLQGFPVGDCLRRRRQPFWGRPGSARCRPNVEKNRDTRLVSRFVSWVSQFRFVVLGVCLRTTRLSRYRQFEGALGLIVGSACRTLGSDGRTGSTRFGRWSFVVCFGGNF